MRSATQQKGMGKSGRSSEETRGVARLFQFAARERARKGRGGSREWKDGLKIKCIYMNVCTYVCMWAHMYVYTHTNVCM